MSRWNCYSMYGDLTNWHTARTRWIFYCVVTMYFIGVIGLYGVHTYTSFVNQLNMINNCKSNEVESSVSEILQSLENSLTLTSMVDSPSSMLRNTTKSNSRAIVIPLFDGIAELGISAILQLRRWGNTELIEVTHCGDLSSKNQMLISLTLDSVVFYDVCAKAWENGWKDENGNKQMFCSTFQECRHKFQSFYIKPLSVLMSPSDEILLIDADILMVQDPQKLFEHEGYQQTGSLFFHDRVACNHQFLDSDKANEKENALFEYVRLFNKTKFKSIPTNQREDFLDADNELVKRLGYSPSQFLLESHSWNRRTGHQQDSSIVLWNKKELPRATSILASFFLVSGSGTPPSYGDKECFFLACELAEAKYFFSPIGVATVGINQNVSGSVLCGEAMHYYPDLDRRTEVLYVNGEEWINFKVKDDIIMTVATPAEFYPGYIDIAVVCLYNRTLVPVDPIVKVKLLERQKYYQIAQTLMSTRILSSN